MLRLLTFLPGWLHQKVVNLLPVAKRSELVSAITSYATARATNDPNLVQFSAELLNKVLDAVEFDPEEAEQTQEEVERN